MSEHNQSRNSRQIYLPKNRTSSEPSAGESPGRCHGKIRRFLGKVKNATKWISHSKDSSSHDPVLSNIDCEGASSMPNIKDLDAPSGVEQGAGPQLALQTAKQAVKLIKPPLRHTTSTASTAQNTPAGLEAAYNFQDTYLQPLRIFDKITLHSSSAVPQQQP
ncbi:hypothetical protein DFJ58DRAFT_737792 [Suillus subalutaceus]|uniref:uncharacterized protein n=1 Tax=Suillus subalutaceus TaxID=48586 RepID=UPI001B864272|nr:uncharacterized protein DFJ58DRAFT_737792 [Suillus subalutaceus]KAG1828459.1 hypothetical protein DFJ58DRAFT_737792 [Suillus subalutaceus]